MSASLDMILSQWVRVGTTFNVAPSHETPDIEDLIVRTAKHASCFSRLVPMTVAWLVQYENLVCRHRLAHLCKNNCEADTSATLGYILSLARHESGTSHYNIAIKECVPLSQPHPLYEVDDKNEQSRHFAFRYSDQLSLEWGLWAPEERPYQNALMSPEWVMQMNPILHYRAIFNGKLQATIITSLKSKPSIGKSETTLAIACNATRVAIRDALAHLELCGYVSRILKNGRKTIQLSNVDHLFGFKMEI